jgi:signal transduction histidine kinase
MKDYIWNNPEIKRLILLVIAANFILTIGFSLYSKFYLNSLNIKLIDENIGTIGTHISRHPELKTDIISAFTKEPSQSDIERGITEAQKYGYDVNLPLKSNGILSSYQVKNLSSILLFIVMSLFATIAIVLLSFSRIYKRLNHIALAAKKIVEGDYSVKLYEEREGTLSILGHQFNQMSNRLQLSMEELKEEKLYLKDTIADISHQLKTPLTALKMLNDLLLEGAAEKKGKREEFLQRSKVQLERMEWLILSLLKLARIETGTIEFQNKKASLQGTVEEAVNDLEINWKQKKLKVEILKSHEEIMILHDKQWLKEAFLNIIKNSIEYTSEEGSISIELAETPVMARIVIEDNGEGILKEDLPYIFQRFYRGKNRIYGKGTGIGLALAKSIIENENGIITAKSELGKGTTFIITFLKNVVLTT